MIKKILIQYKNNERFRQVLSLYAVNIFGIPLAIVTSVIVTRFLGVKAYGDFMFLNNIFNLTILLLTFGFLQAGNRALVLTNDVQKSREYYGAELLILGCLYLIMVVSLFIYSSLDSNLTQKGLQTFIKYLIPFSWVYLVIRYFEVLFQADNKINLLVITRLFPKVGFLISAITIYFFLFNFKGNRLIIIYSFFLLTQMLVFFYVLYKVKMSFKNIKNRIKEIWYFNKSFGFDVYLGSVLAIGFSQLSGVLISYFGIDNTGVGHYSLALTFATPLSFIPNVIATTHYKDFSTKNAIPNKLLIITFGLSVSALLLLWLLVPPFITYFYKKEFYPVIALNFIVSIGIIFHGFADFFNRFLSAHGQGKALRNSAFIVGLSLMVLNITLIPLIGEKGAAFTKAITGIIYCVCMLWYYKHLVLDLFKGKRSKEI